MADDKNKNEDPEKNDDLFDDDEDFGLPDLDYDDLDDEFDDDLLDEEIEADLANESEEESVVEPEEETVEEPVAESSTESDTSESSLLDDEIDISDDDLKDVDAEFEEGDDWEKELEKELEDELSSGEVDSFYEEESFDEFEADENAGANVFDADSDDTDVIKDEAAVDSGFVADDTSDTKDDYYIANINKDEAAKAKESAEEMSPEEYAKYFGDEAGKNKTKFTRTVVIGTISFLAIGALFLFLWNTFGGSDEPKKVAKTEKVVPKKETPKPAPAPKKEETKPKPKPKPKAVEQTPGEIRTLAQATSKSYIVIASFFDGDMATDHAEKLAKQGKSPMIIPPFSEYRFYRVAIAEFESFADAKAGLAQYQGEYGQDVWPLRY